MVSIIIEVFLSDFCYLYRSCFSGWGGIIRVHNHCIEMRYRRVQACHFHMLFTHPLPTPNIRMLEPMSTGSYDAGGSCPDLSSHNETCLEARYQIAAFLWQWEHSSILSQEVPRLPLYCTGRHFPCLHYSTCVSPVSDKRLWSRCLKLILQAVGVSSTLRSKLPLDTGFS